MASSPKIDELRKKFEENPRRYFAPLANEYRKAGDWEQAIAICREYLPQQPGHMSGHIVFGQALFEAKQLDEAKTVFETALSLDPENLIALKHLGDITMAAGDKDGAKGWYKRVLDADPRNEEAQAQMAILEPKAAAAATPVVPQPVTPTSKTVAMPAAQAGAAASAPTVVMQAMRPLPKLGATGLPMPAVPKPGAQPSAPPSAPTTAKPTPVPSLSSQPTMPIQIPTAPAASAPTVVMSPPVVPPKAPAAVAPTEEIKLEGFSTGADSASKVVAGSTSVAATVIMEAAPGMKPVSAADVPVAPTVGLETTAHAASEPPIGSFSLEGLETTSMAAPPPPAAPAMDAGAIDLDLSVPAAPPPPPLAAPAAPAAPVAAAPEIELDLPASAAAPQPAPPAPVPTIDLDFAAPAAPAAPAVAAAPVAATPAPEGLVDLDISIPAPAEAPAPAPVAPPPVVPAPPAPAPVAATPAPVELEIETPAPAPDSGPFVTETMAELYLKQGHRDEALKVYRALLEQRPGDPGITARIAELSGAAAPAPLPAPVAEQEPVLPPLPPADGPTIRAVLMLIAMRRPGYRPDALGNGASHADHAPPSVATDAEVPHGADSLSAIWGHVAPAPEEENAALMLSAAFADLDGHTHGNGAMDFSAAAAAATAAQAATAAALASGGATVPSNFSFDKFFSARVTAEHAAQSARAAGTPVESKEDVAHFTQWLEGLKQR